MLKYKQKNFTSELLEGIYASSETILEACELFNTTLDMVWNNNNLRNSQSCVRLIVQISHCARSIYSKYMYNSRTRNSIHYHSFIYLSMYLPAVQRTL